MTIDLIFILSFILILVVWFILSQFFYTTKKIFTGKYLITRLPNTGYVINRRIEIVKKYWLSRVTRTTYDIVPLTSFGMPPLLPSFSGYIYPTFEDAQKALEEFKKGRHVAYEDAQ